jgi:hypothetical protein
MDMARTRKITQVLVLAVVKKMGQGKHTILVQLGKDCSGSQVTV